MIVCKNCGARYDEKELNCPYCQYENVAAAQKQYHEELDLAIREREQLKNLPKEMARKRTKKIVVVAILLFLGIVFIIGGIRYYEQYGPQSDFAIEKNNKEVMEQYLEEGNYPALSDYYRTVGWNMGIYEKYEEVKELYDCYEDIEWRISQIKYYFPTSRKEEQAEQVAKAMKEFSQMYEYYNTCVNDTKRLANDKYLEDIWNMGKADFMQAYFMNEEMVHDVLEIECGDDISVYNELAESVAENLVLQLK